MCAADPQNNFESDDWSIKHSSHSDDETRMLKVRNQQVQDENVKGEEPTTMRREFWRWQPSLASSHNNKLNPIQQQNRGLIDWTISIIFLPRDTNIKTNVASRTTTTILRHETGHVKIPRNNNRDVKDTSRITDPVNKKREIPRWTENWLKQIYTDLSSILFKENSFSAKHTYHISFTKMEEAWETQNGYERNDLSCMLV